MPLMHVNIDNLNPHHIELIDQEKVEIVEANEGGAGKVVFSIRGEAIRIRHAANKPPLRWLKNQKCADGAIVLDNDGEICLHLVELKKTVTHGKWEDIKEQFEGMLHNALAVLAVLDVRPPTKILCHLAYEAERISPQNAVDPIFLKLPVGKNVPLGCFTEWNNSVVDLKYYKKIELRKIERDAVTGTGAGCL